MKTFLLALVAACASAETTVVETSNECFKGQGGRWVSECSDVYFFSCDIYEVSENTACNVFTFSDSRVTWTTSELTVHYWTWLLGQD